MQGKELGRGKFGVTKILIQQRTKQQFAGKFIPLNQVRAACPGSLPSICLLSGCVARREV